MNSNTLMKSPFLSWRGQIHVSKFIEIHPYQSVQYASFKESTVYKTDFGSLNEIDFFIIRNAMDKMTHSTTLVNENSIVLHFCNDGTELDFL